MTGTYWNRKKFPSSEGLPAHCWQKNRKIFMLQKLHEKNGSTSEKEEWRRLEGKNPTKWHWEKGSWRWGLDKIEALQNGSGIFICFIKSWMHWFDHFLTKLSKYLWIKTGDRHYHFVEPWVIDRPFCRMGTPLPPSEWEGGWFWTLLYGLGISMHFYAFLCISCFGSI